MASADQTLSDSGSEFEADETERTATLRTRGGIVTNTGDKDAIIDVDANTGLVLVQPAGASGRFLPPGASVALPTQCGAFTFLAAAAPNDTVLLFSKN